MSDVVIYQPTKNAMQSGRAGLKQWVLEYERQDPARAEPVIGWIASGDTRQQVRLKFDAKEAAIAYAERNRLSYRILEPQTRKLVKKSYADTFRWDRVT